MICEFPSYEFYDGKLKADPSVLQHFCALEGFWPSGPHCPIAFCDIVGKEGGASSHHKAHQESKCNEAEANKIVSNWRYMCTMVISSKYFTGGNY